jgi:nitric oxide reductase activation protein
MSDATCHPARPSGDLLPVELLELRDRVQAQPVEVRAELEPLMEDVLEHSRFRGRILSVARDALERLRLDLELTRFDLDATRREREMLRQRLSEQE